MKKYIVELTVEQHLSSVNPRLTEDKLVLLRPGVAPLGNGEWNGCLAIPFSCMHYLLKDGDVRDAFYLDALPGRWFALTGARLLDDEEIPLQVCFCHLWPGKGHDARG